MSALCGHLRQSGARASILLSMEAFLSHLHRRWSLHPRSGRRRARQLSPSGGTEVSNAASNCPMSSAAASLPLTAAIPILVRLWREDVDTKPSTPVQMPLPEALRATAGPEFIRAMSQVGEDGSLGARRGRGPPATNRLRYPRRLIAHGASTVTGTIIAPQCILDCPGLLC
jgi:hypothetical protein